MTPAVALSGAALRRARATLKLSQMEAGQVLGGLRQETISRWEQRRRVEPHAASEYPMRELIEVSTLLLDMYPARAARRDPARRQRFLDSPQRGLRGRSPRAALAERPPYGVHELWQFLMEIAHGLPA